MDSLHGLTSSGHKKEKLMYEPKFPHLFEPIILNRTYFKNRIFASPQGTSLSTYGNQPTTENMMFYERKAMGGAAAVCYGDATVDSEHGMGNGPHIHLDDFGNCVHLNRMAKGVSRHGAVASIELNHCGSSSRVSYDMGHKIYGAIATDTKNFHHEGDIIAEEMPPDIIQETIEKFANAAWLCQHTGFGMVTLHGGHGWLLTQFMHPTNNRTDEWGGSFENRMRFPLAVLEAIRKKCPGLVIEMRISGSEIYDGGYDLDYGVEIAKALDGHLDLIHVSAGCHERDEVFTITHPNMFLEDGVNVKYAAEIKKHVETPVACVGSLSDAQMMEDIIASGKADVVEIARGLSADPDLPNKAQAGNDKDIRQCLRCSSCFSHVLQGEEYSCAINPQIGWSMEQKFPRVPADKKRVLVAGGGIAGMTAAITAAKRGHEVILLEKEPELGGVLKCEKDVPFKYHLHQYLQQQARFVKEAGVEIHTDTAATPEVCESYEADAVIAAIGANEFVVPLPGIGGPNVISAQELYVHPEEAGDSVVILGGGLVGQELSVYLGMRGVKCTIIEMLPQLNAGGNILQQNALNLQYPKYGTEIHTSTKATEVLENGVRTEDADGNEGFYEASKIVTAMGMRPRQKEALSLRLCAPEFYLVGDALVSKSIREANWNAYQAAMDIGIQTVM